MWATTWGERESRSTHAVAHIVDLLFSQSTRSAVRKEEGCAKSLLRLAMFGRWDSGAAPLGGEGGAERMEEREVRKEAAGDGKRKTLH